MDLSDYLEEDPSRLEPLSRRSLIQIVRIKRLAADRGQAVRYMTARRLVRASEDVITMEALKRRGEMRGSDTYSGPLGEEIARIASDGPLIATRLATAGIASDHFTEVLLRGRIPSYERIQSYLRAFAPDLTEKHFHEHAAWRRAHP